MNRLTQAITLTMNTWATGASTYLIHEFHGLVQGGAESTAIASSNSSNKIAY
jgi:hypothetical protein